MVRYATNGFGRVELNRKHDDGLVHIELAQWLGKKWHTIICQKYTALGLPLTGLGMALSTFRFPRRKPQSLGTGLGVLFPNRIRGLGASYRAALEAAEAPITRPSPDSFRARSHWPYCRRCNLSAFQLPMYEAQSLLGCAALLPDFILDFLRIGNFSLSVSLPFW